MQTPEISELMPKGFLRILAKRTGLTDPSAISRMVNYEQRTRKEWPEVLKLAKETDPEGFARWEESHAVAA